MTCTPIPISRTSIYYLHIYVECIHIDIDTYMYMHVYIHTYIPSFVRAAIPTHVGARTCACPHVCAHTRERASAAPPRTTARAASTTRPSASRLRWRAARAGKAAHT